jgi:hypothetical protein
MPVTAGTPAAPRYASRVEVARQELAMGDAARTTKPATHTRALSSSSAFTPVLPICGAVITTIWRQ